MDKKTTVIVLGVLILIIIAGVFVVRPMLQDRTVVTVVNEKIDRPALNVSFEFPSGDDGYSFIEPPLADTEPGDGPEAAFIMIETAAYTEFQQPNFEGEAPKSMSIFIFGEPEVGEVPVASGTPRLDRTARLRNWVEANNGLTAYALAQTAPEEVVIDGVKMLHYQTDGLYQQDVYVGLHRNRYYLFVGQYDGEADPAYATFKKLVSSISFY